MVMEKESLSTYNHAAEVIKDAILQGQYEALKSENRIQLSVYFGIGKYVSSHSRKEKWGAGALAAISGRLRKILPGLRGFSAENLKKMRQFYEEWSELEAKTETALLERNANSVFANTELRQEVIDIHHAMVMPNTADFPAMDFLAVPFTRHLRILDKVKSRQERCCYIRRCAQEHLSVDSLIRLIQEGAGLRQKEIPNNFSLTTDDKKNARKVA